LIPQLLAPGSLQDIGWVLTDALYLKAAWASPFQAGAPPVTFDRPYLMVVTDPPPGNRCSWPGSPTRRSPSRAANAGCMVRACG
jgi:hypothetical protein